MVRAIVLRAPGTNCDVETVFAFQRAGAEASLVHVNRLIRKEERLTEYQILAIPGGFTYGDDIAAGKVLANELRVKLGEDIMRFIEGGRLILGICNGFQVLVKAGFLPEPSRNGPPGMTLAINDSGKFECRWVHLQVNRESPCVFTRGMESMYIPVAHGEGKVVAETDLLPALNVVVRYADTAGDTRAGYPHNPNGSLDNIAGICDASGRIFALMPHPERHILGIQHPQWMRRGIQQYGDGFPVFQNAVKWAQKL